MWTKPRFLEKQLHIAKSVKSSHSDVRERELMAVIGYIRVSTIDQNSDLQRNALTSANCARIFEDRMSGKVSSYLGLKRALKCVNSGDTLVVWSLDRLRRSVKNLIALISELHERGAHFRSLTDRAELWGASLFHVMSALAEMERELIVERTMAGLAEARAQGRISGRTNALKAHEREQIWATIG